MKKNKKGFTLVELLAVIVILGVLLMIAVPAIQNVIANSQRKSFESAAKLAIENAETMASSEKVGTTFASCIVFIADTSYQEAGATSSSDYKGMELERGSFGEGASGYIELGSDGKGTIHITNDAYNVYGVALSTSNEWHAVKGSKSITIPANKTVCSWVETK